MFIKIVIIVVISLVLINMLKEIKPEFSIYVTIATSITTMFIIVNELQPIYEIIDKTRSEFNFDDELIQVVLRICLIGYLKNFITDICIDYGHKTLADKVDFAARIAMVSLCIPWIKQLMVNINKLL